MKKTLLALVLLAAIPAAAEELTVDKILAAQSFGVSAEAILAKVNDPGNTVAVLTQAAIEARQTTAVAELLSQTPGVSYSRNGGVGAFRV